MTAVWTAPRTWANNELVDQTIMNQHVRDNLEWLKARPRASALLGAAFTTSSTILSDVLSVSLTSAGGGLLVGFSATCQLNSAGFVGEMELMLDGVSQGLMNYFQEMVTNYYFPVSFTYYIPSVAAGAHTIKVRAAVGTAANLLTIYGTGFGVMSQLWAQEV